MIIMARMESLQCCRFLPFWIFSIIFIFVYDWGHLVVQTAPVYSQTSISTRTNDLEEALNYMTKFGYLSRPGNIFGYADLVNLIKDVQFVLHVNQTGVLDKATMSAMRRPRCGMKDAPIEDRSIESHVQSRNKRYVVNWHKWDKRILKYRILNWPIDSVLTNAQVEQHIDRAAKQVSNVTRLIFEKVNYGYADIFIQFTQWTHSDGFPFDGPNGTVAHAFLPDGKWGDFDGDIHFDDSEEWTHEGEKGYNLYQVALHEFGHSLGLEHSYVDKAVMQPAYPGYNKSYTWADDDIRALQLLYGPSEPIEIEGRKTPNPDALCNLVYDAATTIDGKLLIFKDNRYWRLTDFESLLSSKSGQPVKKRFRGVETPIDAIYQRSHDRLIFIFKGWRYWVFRKGKLLPTYPRSIRDGFGAQVPNYLHAALHLDHYNKTYFFQHDYVWRYDEGNSTMDGGYPYNLKEVFEGIPPPIGAAFNFTDGGTYFVQKKKYYRYDNSLRNADPGYPRYFGQDFFGCHD